MTERYYRNVIHIEVLSDRPLYEEEISDLAALKYLMQEGDCSGKVEALVDNAEISREEMAKRLVAHKMEPKYLILDYGRQEGEA